tara:strand:- start:640 stop:1485 length:846 start_codon:yes stop_codon:yes gene_type:complete
VRKLPKPTDKSSEILLLCTSKIRSQDLKDRLEACGNVIDEADIIYEERAGLTELHLIQSELIVNGDVSREEMEKVYTDRLAKKEGPGRSYYNKVISSTTNNKCPLCGHRVVSTLDHHLPKSKFPVYAISPVNLVPSCYECNISKLNHISKTSQDEPLHPYFDNFDDQMWLLAKVVETKPACIKFYAFQPDRMSDDVFERIIHHMKLLKLTSLYVSNSAEELMNINYYISDLYDSAGSEEVKNHLEKCFQSRKKVNLNSWETAFYYALYQSEWYCSGGYRMR